MKLYIEFKKMTFDNGIEHNIINAISDEGNHLYDLLLELPDDDKFIKDTMRIVYKKDKDGKETNEIESRYFIIKEQDTWNSFPLYEYKNGKIIDFDYTQHKYFVDTDRRIALASKINELYNSPSEAKIVRKAIKIIFDKLNIECPEFQKYYNKIEDVINKNPK